MIDSRETDLLTKGLQSLAAKDYNSAQVLFNEVIEINHKNVEAYFNLANIFHMRGEIGKAIKAFNKVLECDPGHTDAAISLSVLYNDIGRYEEAKRLFETTNENIKKKSSSKGIEDPHVNKKFSFKHYELADLYFTYNRYEEALFEYNKACALDPENLEIKIKVAKVFAKKGFMSKAFEELRKLKLENPNYSPARVALGVLFYGNGKVVEAQNEWKSVLAKDPKNSEAAMYLNLSETATETKI